MSYGKDKQKIVDVRILLSGLHLPILLDYIRIKLYIIRNMNSKLTISMDKELINFAHKLAKKSNDSISNIISIFFNKIKAHTKGYTPNSPRVRKLYGITQKNPVPDKEIIYKQLIKKHS